MDKKRLLCTYKGDRCAHCGKTVQVVLSAFGTMSQVFHFNHIKPEKKHLNYGNSMCSRWRWRSVHRNVGTACHLSEVGVYSETPRVCYRGARKTQ